MRPISPNTGADEIVVAEQQEEYLPLSVAFYRFDDGSLGRVTAWIPKADELLTLATALEAELGDTPILLSKGHGMRLLANVFKRHPIYVNQLSFREGQGMTPLSVHVGPADWMLVGDRAPDATLILPPDPEPCSDSPTPPGE